MMRILSVRQPWAYAIIHQGKDVENRSRAIVGGYRGQVAIHAAVADAVDAPEDLWRAHSDHYRPSTRGKLPTVRGAIIGVVDLTDVHHAGHCYAASIDHAAHLYREDRAAFDALPIVNGSGGLLSRADYCSPWADETDFHLVLTDPRPLAVPIPFKGGLGLRRLDPGMVARITEAIA